MKRTTIMAGAAIAAIAAVALWNITRPSTPHVNASGKEATAQLVIPATFSDEAKMGERAFNAVCATCHGKDAAGTDVGPPLVHRIYEPSHHADYAFEMAVANGVRAHHWKFGNMPPQPGVTKADIATIVAYVRELRGQMASTRSGLSNEPPALASRLMKSARQFAGNMSSVAIVGCSAHRYG